MSGTHSSSRTALGPRRTLVVVFALLGSLFLPVSAAEAGRPRQESLRFTNVRCLATGTFGAARLFVSHSDTGAGFPGADLAVWEPGKDPDLDVPALVGTEVNITHDGPTLRGLVPLHRVDPGEEPKGDDRGTIEAWAAYELTYSLTTPSLTERLKGAVVSDHKRLNVRFRTDKTRTPLTASGTLTLPGSGPVDLSACSGDMVVEQTVLTAPSTVVASGRYPLGFEECVARAPSGSAQINMLGGEISAVVWPQGSDQPDAVGGVFGDATRTTLTAQLAMIDYGSGDERGVATLSARLKVVGRQRVRISDGGTTDTVMIERVRVSGQFLFEGVRYDLDSCEGDRARQLRVER